MIIPTALFFELPTERPELLRLLIERFPTDWEYIDGVLNAPENLVRAERIALNSGLEFDRFGNIEPKGQAKGVKPSPYEIYCLQRHPRWIRFYEACYLSSSSRTTFEEAKRMAAFYVGIGYTGRLDLHRHVGEHYGEHTAEACFQFQSWIGQEQDFQWQTREEVRQQPARIRIEYREKHHGRPEHVALVITLCRELGLREYRPVV